jgi:hypothetical protein
VLFAEAPGGVFLAFQLFLSVSSAIVDDALRNTEVA